jgi:pentose-5-phosphate-3-epimerase
MDISRFVIAGSFFIVSYVLHRNLSFREYKKVGVAIYADGVEDIKLIFNKISNISDFIHIDIVDTTFNPNSQDVKAYRAEVVRAYWQNKKIEVHIMSRNPSVWLDDLLPYVDVIYVHPTMDENLSEVIDKINFSNVEAGIALSVYEPLEIIDCYIETKKIKHVLLLTIPQPGFSGQKFDASALPLLEKLNAHKNRSEFEICVDGGVNDSTVKYLNVESVVSGSYILSAPNPIKNIMHLQTSGEYAQY